MNQIDTKVYTAIIPPGKGNLRQLINFLRRFVHRTLNISSTPEYTRDYLRRQKQFLDELTEKATKLSTLDGCKNYLGDILGLFIHGFVVYFPEDHQWKDFLRKQLEQVYTILDTAEDKWKQAAISELIEDSHDPIVLIQSIIHTLSLSQEEYNSQKRVHLISSDTNTRNPKIHEAIDQITQLFPDYANDLSAVGIGLEGIMQTEVFPENYPRIQACLIILLKIRISTNPRVKEYLAKDVQSFFNSTFKTQDYEYGRIIGTLRYVLESTSSTN